MKFIKTSDGRKFWFQKIKNEVWIHFKGDTFLINIDNQKRKSSVSKSKSISQASSNFQGQKNCIYSSLPGRVLTLNFQKGAFVKKEAILIVIESMKMEHSIKAPKDLKIVEILVEEGKTVKNKEKLIVFENQ